MQQLSPRFDSSPAARRWLLLATLVVFAGALWGLTRGSAEAATSGVTIRDFSFQPAEVTVRVGDTVTWTNQDSETHAVQGGPFNSPDLPPGATFSHTFDSTGDVNYICRIHTYMSGVVHVVSASETTTTTAAPTTTSTTAAPSTTSTTAAPGASTTTTAPDGSPATTTTTAPPSSGGGPAFQEVPDDPSATYPPGSPEATTPPPRPTTTTTSAPSSTTTTAPPSSTTTSDPHPQEVPPDDDASTPPSGSSGTGGTDLGDGTVLAPFTVDGGVKVFHLDMAPTTVETAPGITKPAYAFNGVVPGPVLRVDEGDRVRIVVTNHLPFATAVHWHGMVLPNDQDGVPGITQPFIEPGEAYTYEWTAVATGTHWYHSHTSGRHIGKGLYGALEVVPRTGDVKADRDYRMVLGDSDLGFVINGRSFPSTVTLPAKVGETVRVRVINAGDQVHAIHLHGTTFDVVAQDGNPMAVPVRMDTLTISPGQTFDLVAKEANPGKWLLHCHIFAHSHMSGDDHMAGDSGMTGMVTMLDVLPADAVLPPSPLVTQPIAAHDHAPVSPGGPALPIGVVLVAAVAVALTGARTLRFLPLHNRKDNPA